MGTFNNDYKRSRKAEIDFENHLQQRYNLKTENSGDKGMFYDWDISSTAKTGRVITFEVKKQDNYFDLELKNSTVVIETARIIDKMSIPCGLSLTKAEYYVFQFEDDTNFYLIKVDTLKQLTSNHKLKEKKIIHDNNGYLLHIFDKPFIIDQCTVI